MDSTCNGLIIFVIIDRKLQDDHLYPVHLQLNTRAKNSSDSCIQYRSDKNSLNFRIWPMPFSKLQSTLTPTSHLSIVVFVHLDTLLIG